MKQLNQLLLKPEISTAGHGEVKGIGEMQAACAVWLAKREAKEQSRRWQDVRDRNFAARARMMSRSV